MENPPFFDYGKWRQHFLLSPLDYPPARTDGAVNGGRSPFTCRWLARLDLLFTGDCLYSALDIRNVSFPNSTTNSMYLALVFVGLPQLIRLFFCEKLLWYCKLYRVIFCPHISFLPPPFTNKTLQTKKSYKDFQLFYYNRQRRHDDYFASSPLFKF